MKFLGYDRDGQQTTRVLFDYARNAGLHNGLLMFQEGNPHPLASITAVIGDKEATLTEWNPRECIDTKTQTRIHHWKIEP